MTSPPPDHPPHRGQSSHPPIGTAGSHGGRVVTIVHQDALVPAEFESLPPIMSIDDVATHSHLHQATIRRAITSGVLPAYQPGTKWRILRSDYIAWFMGERS